MSRPHLIPFVQPTDRLVGQAPSMVALRTQIRHLVTFDTLGNPFVPTVLLQGETGTGKGLVAQVIHESGPRAQGLFVEVNCAAIPESLLEAELFGFEGGAFTDARRAKPGLWEAASGGILFLDETDALPLTLQSKLLTVIESKRVRRLGSVVEHPVDVKLIAATQAALHVCVAERRFRADLYHRLAVVLLEVPPLRDRGVDVTLLAQHYLQRYAEAHRLKRKQLSRQAETWLQRYTWPGNVRELAHLMERVTLLSPDPLIASETLEQLCVPLSNPAPSTANRPAEEGAELMDEATQIRQALQQTAGNVARAARLLGMSRGAFRHRMARYGIASASQVSEISFRPSQQSVVLHDGAVARQDDRRVAPLIPEQLPPDPGWEWKPVAILAVEMTWSLSNEGQISQYEPWTVADYWEQAIIEKVQGFGGVVLPHSPSLVMVAFGVPRTLEQAPQRAVQAALALRCLVAEATEAGPYPELRMAIHWGHLLVDTGVGDPTTHLLPGGDTLSRPGRLVGYAEPGEILASSEMRLLVDGGCELRAREELLGIWQPDQIDAYTIVGLKPLGSLFKIHRQRPLSRFVGRAETLTALENLLASAENGRGQVVGIVGEPGVGKSRLCYEFIWAHPTQGWLILETSADSYGQTSPYLPVIDLLKSYFQIASRDDASTVRDKVTDKLRTLGPSIESSLPALLSLLNVPVEDAAWQALDPQQRRQRILDAIKRLLVRQSQIQPILLVVENLHWIDGETQALLNTLVEGLAIARMLLLVSYRPEYQHGWGSKTYYTQLRLDPLPREHAQALLDSLLGDDVNLVPLMQSLWQRTGGNPFFLEESVQTLVEVQVLVGTRGAYRLAKPLQSIQVPATVQAVLAARVDRLPAQEKRLLQTAAVVGMEVPFALVQAVAELPEEELRHGLAHLQATEFLYEARLFPELAYTFKHALTHEVAYGNLLQERRRVLHGRIVEALEALAGDRVAAQVELLAHHALRGEMWEKAVPYCRQAGEKARNSGAFHEAVACFEQALNALGHLPEHLDTGVLAIELYHRFGGVLSLVGEHARSLALLGEAEALARQLGDCARLGGVLARMVTVRTIVGDVEGAKAAGQEALELAATLGDPALHVHASYHLGQTYAGIGDYGRAAALLRGNVAALARSTPGEIRLWCIKSQARLAEVLGMLGEFAEGRRHGEEALRLAMMDGQWQSDAPIYARARLGSLYHTQGDLEAAIRVCEEGLALCRASGQRASLGSIAGSLGEAYAHMGRLVEGLALLEEARRDDLRTGGVGSSYVSHLRQLSAVYLLAGRFDEAWQHAHQALDLARQQKARGEEALVLHQLGVVQAHATPPDVAPAEAHYRQALALAEELGMRPLQAHCHLGFGTLYAKMGRHEPARAELSTAIELSRAMDMTFWLPQAEAALERTL